MLYHFTNSCWSTYIICGFCKRKENNTNCNKCNKWHYNQLSLSFCSVHRTKKKIYVRDGSGCTHLLLLDLLQDWSVSGRYRQRVGRLNWRVLWEHPRVPVGRKLGVGEKKITEIIFFELNEIKLNRIELNWKSFGGWFELKKENDNHMINESLCLQNKTQHQQ